MTAYPSFAPLPVLAAGDPLAPATVTAFNNSEKSDNKIHDDAVARSYGFKGGLVPGVTVFAYMASPLAAAFGERWLTQGEATVALVRPLYQGEMATAQARVTAAAGESHATDLTLQTWVENAEGVHCAAGEAAVPLGEAQRLERPEFAFGSPQSLPAEPPELTLETAPVGETLGTLVTATTPEAAHEYARMVFDFSPLFHEGSAWGPPLLHPGWLLGECNSVFRRNFTFGPWIHTKSEIRYGGPALAGSTLQFHARMLQAYERRGHHYAVTDVFCCDDSGAPLMRVRHTAIFKIRAAG